MISCLYKLRCYIKFIFRQSKVIFFLCVSKCHICCLFQKKLLFSETVLISLQIRLNTIKKGSHLCEPLILLAPGEGFEPPTKWLTATRSAG